MTPVTIVAALHGLVGAGLGTRAAMSAYRDRALRRLIRHAYDRVPHYRRHFDRAGVRPDDVSGVADLARLPLTTRGELQSADEQDLLARGAWHRGTRRAVTSGSSGAPLAVHRTRAEEYLMLAFRARAVGRWGFGPTTTRANVDHFSEHAWQSEGRTRAYERSGLLRRLNVDWRTPVPVLDARLRAFRPDLLSGPPTILADVAERLPDGTREALSLRRVLTGSERLTPSLRERIERGFGAPVTDVFGCTEAGFVAMEAPDVSGYRVCDECVVVEIVDPVSGAPAERHGEIVVTALHQWAMPIVRYRLGDHVVRGAPGETFTTLAAVDGRVTERFRLADGRSLHGYDLGGIVESSGLPVRQFQIVQERVNAFRVRLILGGPAALESLHSALRDALGPDTSVALERVDDIARDGRKFRPFVPLAAETPSHERTRR